MMPGARVQIRSVRRRSGPTQPKTTCRRGSNAERGNPRTDRASVAANDTLTVRTNEHIDRVLLPLIHERGDGPSTQIVKSSANERKANRCEVHDRRSEIQLAEEPWLHGVLISGTNVEQMLRHQRTHMLVDDFIDRRVGTRCHRADQRHASTHRHSQHGRSGPCEQAPADSRARRLS